MYQICIYNNEVSVVERLNFRYLDEADTVAEAFENLTDYSVIREWED